MADIKMPKSDHHPRQVQGTGKGFLQLLSQLQDICDEYLARIKTVRHRIELTSNDMRPVHTTGYHAGQISRKSAAK